MTSAGLSKSTFRTKLCGASTLALTIACNRVWEPSATEGPELAEGEQNLYVVAGNGVDFPLWGNAITLCGVFTEYYHDGDGDYFNRNMDVIREHLKYWEAVSGIRFQYATRCSPPTKVAGADGIIRDNYPEDIRIANVGRAVADIELTGVDGTNLIGGQGCTQPIWQGGTQWARFPVDRTAFRSCRFNAILHCRDDMDCYWTALHEMGHALGMGHEFDRWSAVDPCHQKAEFGGTTLTPVDVDSVMTYDETCRTTKATPTEFDNLGMEIAYPRNAPEQNISAPRIAFGGAMAAFRGKPILPDWRARGALSSVFGNFRWWKNGFVDLTVLDGLNTADLTEDLPVDIGMTFTDPWGRPRQGNVTIIPSDAKAASVIGVVAFLIGA